MLHGKGGGIIMEDKVMDNYTSNGFLGGNNSKTGYNKDVRNGSWTSSLPINVIIPLTDPLTDLMGLFFSEENQDQAWFWTKQWQVGEREAEKEFAEGQGIRFKNSNEAINHLKSTRLK